MKIRKAKIEDGKDIKYLRYLLAKYEKELGLDIVEPDWSFSIEGENDLKYFFDKQYVYVAEENNKIVGYITGEILSKKVWYNVQLGSINNIFVLEEYRNRGIGKELIRTMIETFKRNNINNIELYAYSQNVKALKFYEAIGFKKCNIQMLYQSNGGENEISSNI